MSDLDEFEDGSEEEEVDAMAAAEVLQKLEEAWLNEKFSPDLLEAKTELVECMLEQLSEMEENIKRAKRGDFRVSVHRMEIDRIRYVLSSYLRSRLQKIEKYTAHVLEQEANRKEMDVCQLSPEEYTFAEAYSDTVREHFEILALRHMPKNLQELDHKQTAIRPNLDKHVFLRVNKDTEGVLVEEETLESGEEIVDLTKGDQHIMRYRPVAPLVTSSAVTLI